MKKLYHYLVGLSLCLLIVVGIISFANRNHIYTWWLGDVDALYKEAVACYKEHKYDEALPLFEKLAGIDTASYCKFVLGNMYRHGLGTLRNSMTAFDWYRKAAAHGDADAMNNLGYMYVCGFGKLMDIESALFWYERAAAKNHPVAQYNLAALYAEGRGVERDLGKCAEWLKKSANQGLAASQFNLGNMYYLGKGVEKDWEIAKKWYGMAKNQGHRTAELFLERLEQEQNIAELDSNFSMTLIAD